jgi:SAM-dependent methyltransferase
VARILSTKEDICVETNKDTLEFTCVKSGENMFNRQHKLIRSQPPDENHTRLAKEVITEWQDLIPKGLILDIGCGQGFCKPLFEAIGCEWHGVTLGKDFDIAVAKYPSRVYKADMHILSFESSSFDFIFARHVLEHSHVPVYSLSRWSEIADKAIVVVPRPSPTADSAEVHLSVLRYETWLKYFYFTGWLVYKFKNVEYSHDPPSGEYRFFLERI